VERFGFALPFLPTTVVANLAALKSKKRAPTPRAATAQDRPLAAKARTPSRRRQWLFRLVALLIPLAIFGLLEAGLRLLGVGASPDFFLKSGSAGRPVFIDNPRFAERYFPPALARSAQPLMLAAEKPADTVRIFVLGESAAMGDPEPAFGFARLLRVLLEAQHPGKRIEVVNAAVTAINSHVIRDIARDCARRQGDLWIVYLGNNEVVGPFGAGTVFGAQTLPLPVIRAHLALKATRLGQALDAALRRLGRKSAPSRWEGMEMFLQQQVPADAPRLRRVYAHFESNLGEILDTAADAGVPVLLSTVAVNLKDCPPFASLQGATTYPLPAAERERLRADGARWEAATNHAAALAEYEKAARREEGFAEWHHALGRCQAALGRHAEARKSFERARDLDTLRFRADSRLNAILRDTAAKRGTRLFDAEALFARESPDGLTGGEFFLEHVHFTFAGNYLLARALAAEVPVLTKALRPAGTLPPPLSAEECARRLALTAWERSEIAQEMLRRLELPPFTQQAGHESRLARLRAEAAALERDARRPETRAADEAMYPAALRATPRADEDWQLHENFARWLETLGDPAEAEREWRRVTELQPHYVAGWHGLANVLDGLGQHTEAARCFREALRRRPGAVESMNGLALALDNAGQRAEAVRAYERALRQKPDFLEARVNLGQALAQEGKFPEAEAHYREALRLNSNHVAAHINLGKLLAATERVGEAAGHYREAVRLKPDHAIAHYNLGNALATLNDPAATTHFAEAARLNPGLAEARVKLGLAYSREGRQAEALAEFEAAARAGPDLAVARFNLGVALAKGSRFREAAVEFRETLRLEPGNATARKFLEQAEARTVQEGR
jgi:tetratricopeptide (TPR) repeat protein